MNIGGFPAHGKEQPKFVATSWQDVELDAAAMRREAANDPVSVQPAQRDQTERTARLMMVWYSSSDGPSPARAQ